MGKIILTALKKSDLGGERAVIKTAGKELCDFCGDLGKTGRGIELSI